jgi:3-oxo-5alpha-steroid 4-dehydrogenase
LAEDKRAAHQRLYAKVVPMLPFKAKLGERSNEEARAIEAQSSKPRLIRARSGVVLSTGGFCFNLKLLAEHQPFFAKHYRALMRLGSLGCDGSGITLGQSVGGATDRMDSLYAARNIAPPPALLDGVLVNKQGERFISEEAYSGFLGLAISQQTGGEAYLILPAASFRRALKQSVSSGFLFFKFYGVPALLNFFLGGTKRARTLGGLAAKCGLDPSGLRATVARYDQDLSEQRPDALGKSEAHRVPLAKGPYYAVNMSIPNIYAFTYLFTLGGLVVDEDSGTVKRPDGSLIDGLYAAGRAAVGLCSNGYLSGMSIGDGMFSGRRAGRSAAARSNASSAQLALESVKC